MSPRQLLSNALERLREAWQTWLVLSAIVLVSVSGLRMYDRLLTVAENNAEVLATLQTTIHQLVTHQDSVFRWRQQINSLLCSAIYPERQQQAALLGLCADVPLVPFIAPPPSVRRGPRGTPQ